MRPLLLGVCALLAMAPLLAAAPPSLPAEARADARLARAYAALTAAYGEAIGPVTRHASGHWLVQINGSEVLFEDGREKDFPTLLNAPDVEDTFNQVYPLTNPTDSLPKNFDPGRFRVEPMFQALYGHDARAVEAGCTTVLFCGQKVRFSQRCGAADALTKVSAELEKLFAKSPGLRVYTRELGGTFQWRTVAGTTRLSNHSFANSIDLNVSKAAYWKWDGGKRLATFTRSGFPQEIIEAFERHGFIWGGKWYHYDTMHFEYRPELIAYANAHPAPSAPGPAGNE